MYIYIYICDENCLKHKFRRRYFFKYVSFVHDVNLTYAKIFIRSHITDHSAEISKQLAFLALLEIDLPVLTCH